MANGENTPVRPVCIVGTENRMKIENLQQKAAELKAVDDEQWEAINVLRNRLPTWAVFVISGLSGLVGVCATLLAK